MMNRLLVAVPARICGQSPNRSLIR